MNKISNEKINNKKDSNEGENVEYEIPEESIANKIKVKQNYFNNPYTSYFYEQNKNKNKKTNNINNFDENNNKPTKLKEIENMEDINQKLNPKTQHPIKRKIYTNVNKFFFKDYQQKYIKIQRISDIEKDELERELVKESMQGQYALNNYCINYIETNVLPLFKISNLSNEQREIIKYNLEVILKCCGKDKNTYINYYYPEAKNKKKEIDRGKSMDALRRFRKEFGVSEKDYADEGIIQRLAENDYDINKTFQKIFGI